MSLTSSEVHARASTSKSRKILQSDEDFFGIIFTPARNSKQIHAGDFYFRALTSRTLGHSPRPAASRSRTQNTPSREHFPCTHPKTLATLTRLKRFRISSKEIGESEHFLQRFFSRTAEASALRCGHNARRRPGCLRPR